MKYNFITRISIGVLLFLMLFGAGELSAAQSHRTDTAAHLRERICARLRTSIAGRPYTFLLLPSFCAGAETEPPEVNLSANPLVVTAGATTTLSWMSDRANSCSASQGWSGAKSVSGSQIVMVQATTTYSLACVNEAGSDSDSVTVGIVSAPPPAPTPTVAIAALPNPVFSGATTTLTWNSANAINCSASGAWGGSKMLSGNEVVTVNATSTYSISCGNTGATTTDAVVVGVRLLPAVSLSANPSSITTGATSTLAWSSMHADSCIAAGGWSGLRELSGSEIISPAATTTYSLSCNAFGMATTTASTTVSVVAAPATATVIGHVVISEIFYDVDSVHGSEPANEWIELYNGSSSVIDLWGWTIWDSATSSFDTFLEGTTIAPDGFLVITTDAATSTSSFWEIPSSTPVVLLGNSIGSNGLSNTGDALFLKDTTTTVDAVSYGTNTFPFDPAATDVPEGSSLQRKNLTSDSDTATDWEEDEPPTPGS